MKIALAQMDVKAGKPEINVNKILDFIKNAKIQQCDIICFPEMCVSGYLVGDKWLEDDFCLEMMSYNQQIIDASEGICVIWGNVYLDQREYIKIGDIWSDNISKKNVHDDGRQKRYNASYIYYDKKPLTDQNNKYGMPDIWKHTSRPNSNCVPKFLEGLDGMHFKTLLPNYRYFDDKRYFASPLDIKGSDADLWDYYKPFILNKNGKKYKIGLQICEEVWCDDYRINPSLYSINTKCDFIFNLSASPWTYGKNQKRDKVVIKSIEDATRDRGSLDHCPKIPIYCYVNCVGAQNNGKNILTFDGATTIYKSIENIGIKPILNIEDPYKEDILYFDSENLPAEEISKREPSKIEQKYNAILQGVKHYTEVSGIKKFIIGLSGGIDSSVSLFLLQKVVGKENVIAVNMPSKYNSEKTKTAAKKIAEKLGIRYEVIPIENIFDKQNEEISKVFPNCSDLNTENEQARIRGAIILAGVAARENAVFINNSNKTEIFLGYSTYLGDMNGCFCPLGDLLKYEVYDLGRFINERFGNPIPWNLFPDEYYQFNNEMDIKPSAELKNNQVDPIKIRYHDAIIEQIMDYKKISVKEIKKWHKDGILAEKLGIDPYLIEIYGMDNYEKFEKDIDWLYGLMRKNVWKRIQSPPVIVLSKTAFGFDLRESIL